MSRKLTYNKQYCDMERIIVLFRQSEKLAPTDVENSIEILRSMTKNIIDYLIKKQEITFQGKLKYPHKLELLNINNSIKGYISENLSLSKNSNIKPKVLEKKLDNSQKVIQFILNTYKTVDYSVEVGHLVNLVSIINHFINSSHQDINQIDKKIRQFIKRFISLISESNGIKRNYDINNTIDIINKKSLLPKYIFIKVKSIYNLQSLTSNSNLTNYISDIYILLEYLINEYCVEFEIPNIKYKEDKIYINSVKSKNLKVSVLMKQRFYIKNNKILTSKQYNRLYSATMLYSTTLKKKSIYLNELWEIAKLCSEKAKNTSDKYQKNVLYSIKSSILLIFFNRYIIGIDSEDSESYRAVYKYSSMLHLPLNKFDFCDLNSLYKRITDNSRYIQKNYILNFNFINNINTPDLYKYFSNRNIHVPKIPKINDEKKLTTVESFNSILNNNKENSNYINISVDNQTINNINRSDKTLIDEKPELLKSTNLNLNESNDSLNEKKELNSLNDDKFDKRSSMSLSKVFSKIFKFFTYK